jgi:hypothetical protein
MYICLECGELFEQPLRYKEECGEDNTCCPSCKGDYVQTFRCDECGEWIDSKEYYKVKNKRYCEECCVKLNLE